MIYTNNDSFLYSENENDRLLLLELNAFVAFQYHVGMYVLLGAANWNSIQLA